MKKLLALFTALVLVFALAACGPPSAPAEGDAPSAGVDASASTADAGDAPAPADGPLEPAELVFWDLRVDDPGASMIDGIIADFEAANPGVTVTRTAFNVDDLRNTIKPAINSGEGPDVFSYDAGAGYLGVLANSGLALDMTPYVEKYNWNDCFIDWALAKTTYNGKVYGIANELEMLGVFYNKAIFAEHGIEVPNNDYQEFLDICQKLKDAGVKTPVVLSDQDQWPGFHYESIWMNSFAGPDKVKAAVAGEIPWTDPVFAESLDKFKEFVQMGYCTEKPLGLTYDDAHKVFEGGDGAMHITGTWQVGGYGERMGDNVGFFYMPPSAGIDNCPPGGLGEAVVVNGKTQYPDQAAAFVDFMFQMENMEYWYEAGLIPSVANVDYSTYDILPLFKEVVDEINAAENLGENIDVLMPPLVNDVTKNFIQQLIAGNTTGEQCMQEKQAAFEEEIAAGNYSLE